MSNSDQDQPAVIRNETDETQRDPTRATPPRANPPVDEESHEKGKEQLGKIVGN